jgi:hypothetical protein
LGSFFFVLCEKISNGKKIKKSENGISYCKLPFIYIKKSPERQKKKREKKEKKKRKLVFGEGVIIFMPIGYRFKTSLK